MPELNFECQIGAVIEIYSDKRGKLAEFHNMFLNSGLEHLGTNPLGSYIWVGSGNAPVSPLDTQLSNLIAKTNNTSPRISSAGGVSSSAPYHTWQRIGVRFAAGKVVGTLSEVGLGTDKVLQARALIKDAEGTPTSLTILSDEILDISYTVRVYAPVGDTTGTITLDGNLGGTYNWTMRASVVTQHGHSVLFGWSALRSGNYPGYAFFYNGDIGTVTQRPSGTEKNVSTSTIAYIANSLNCRLSINADTTQGNFTEGVKSVVFCLGWGTYQLRFDPAIPKTDLDTLSLTVGVSFARYAG